MRCISFLVFCLFYVYGSAQVNHIVQFHESIKKAKKFDDTIASLVSLKLSTRLDTTGVVAAISKVIKDKYPKWDYIEREVVSKKGYETSELEELELSTTNKSLKKFVRYNIDFSNVLKGEAPDLERYKEGEEHFSDVEKLLTTFYLFVLNEEMHKNEDCFNLIVEIIELDENLYPEIIVNIIASGLNNNVKITEEYLSFRAKAIRMSESIESYKALTKLYTRKTHVEKMAGNYDEAVKSSLKAIDYSKKAEWHELIIQGQLNHAMFHQEQGRFEEAYAMIDTVRLYAEEIKDTMSIAKTYSSVGFSKMNEEKYGEAILSLRMGNSIYEKFDGSDYFIGLNLVNIIDSYSTSGILDSAYYAYLELEELDPQNKFEFLAYAKTFVVLYHINNKDYKEAQEFIDVGMADAVAYDDKSAMSIVLMAQSKLYEGQGKYKKALEVFKKHMEIEQDFRNEENAAEITKVQMNSEFENEKKILALTNEKESLKLTNERNRARGIGGAGVLIAGLSLFFFYSMWKKNKKIQTQNTKLEELNSVKDTLFQIIGHDLKKPTINFRNVSKSINYLLEKEDYKRLKALGEDVDKDAKRLYNLTDNLLSWALVQKDSINIMPEKIDVRDLIGQNIELFLGLAKRKNIKLLNSVEDGTMAFLDRNSLDTIIRNLMDNALKYTHEGGEIELISKVVEGMLQVAVVDNGVGLDEEVINQLSLGAVSHSVNGTNGEKGNGLGLSLVKELLVKNNSKLTVTSTLGEGANFIIILPMSA